jgi:protein-S-isoprenylcysteine O-methyltransferase Ste14
MQALENRIPPPIVTALFGLLMWLTARYTPGLAPANSVNRFQIRPEERALITLFGSEYQVYQTQVRRWL